MSIKVSPKHGVNPSIPICFFCGKEKNEIALLGRLKGDAEAPRNVIIDYEPCDACKEVFKQGILIVGVSSKPVISNQPPIQDGLYPTGQHVVATKDFICRIFSKDTAEAVIKAGKCLVDDVVVTEWRKQAAALDGEQDEDKNT